MDPGANARRDILAVKTSRGPIQEHSGDGNSNSDVSAGSDGNGNGNDTAIEQNHGQSVDDDRDTEEVVYESVESDECAKDDHDDDNDAAVAVVVDDEERRVLEEFDRAVRSGQGSRSWAVYGGRRFRESRSGG